MDLISVILFLAMYYLRPHEWPGPFSSLHPVQLTMIMGLAALASREKQVRLKDLVQTPHDYALIFFFAWLCFTSGSPYSNFKSIANLIVFYGVIVQTLNSVRRMEIFLTWWCVFILAVSLLAVASESGFDPFGSYQLTHWFMKDRLTLNLSIFNNPNALAHSVVPVIPMLYFLLLWKRPLLIKKLALLTLVPPLYCIYLTVSKGAFISGFATLIVTLIFGRPKYVQIAILTAAIVLGTGALYALPRMTELNKSKSDEAIQGRIAAYTYGYKCVTTMWAGIGYNNWMWGFYNQSRRYKIVKEPRMVNHVLTVRPRLVPERYAKAAHGSFNNMGAELGFTGLALFFGMVWCSIRTLTTCKVSDVEEERVRRILFVLMVSYLVSSWMVDFGYRPTFFMFTAATAAFHRHLRIRLGKGGIDSMVDQKAGTTRIHARSDCRGRCDTGSRFGDRFSRHANPGGRCLRSPSGASGTGYPKRSNPDLCQLPLENRAQKEIGTFLPQLVAQNTKREPHPPQEPANFQTAPR